MPKNSPDLPEAAEAPLRQARKELESRVEQRTAVLKATIWELRREIAQRIGAEEELREEKERYRTLVETIPHGIEELDPEGIITFANAAFHRIHGYPEGTLVGTPIWKLMKSDAEAGRLRERLKTLVREQPQPTPEFHQNRTARGDLIDVRVDWDYKRDRLGKVMGFVAVITDITEQRRAEEASRRRLDALAHVERLSTMGEMVSGLAHELNQPLAAIANYAQACHHSVGDLEGENRHVLLDSLERIADQADRAGRIIRHLREFVRRPESNRSAVNINDLVRDVAVLLEVEMRSHDVRLELALGRSLPAVTVDRIQIEQVITNLVRNAVEAVREMPREQRTVTIHTSIRTPGMLEVAVEDTGKGPQVKDLEELFEPFYTTKANGMGLGLSISRSIVEAHGGRLEAVPNADQGTTLHFTLPFQSEGGSM